MYPTHCPAHIISQGIPIPLKYSIVSENQLLCLHLINHLPCSFLSPKFLHCTLTWSDSWSWIMSSFPCKMHWGSGRNSPFRSTFHLDNGCLIIFVDIIHCCVDLGNALTYIPNYLRLLSTVDLRPTTHPMHHFDRKGKPFCDDLHHRFNITMVLCYFLYCTSP